MKEVIFSGLLTLGILFTLLYSNQSDRTPLLEARSEFELSRNPAIHLVNLTKKDRWEQVSKSVAKLLKKTEGLENYKMVQEKI